jgi:Rieske 2Fe-2S family protein
MRRERRGETFMNRALPSRRVTLTAARLQPRGPELTTVVTDYLFRPEVVDGPGFDPAEVVEFNELVAAQDYAVCERVQQGVRSRAFDHGVYAEKDDLPYRFNRTYLAAREAE